MTHSLRLTGFALLVGLAAGLGCNSNPVTEAACEANGGQSYPDDGQVICACPGLPSACCDALGDDANVRGCETPEASTDPDFASPMAEVLETPAR